MLKCNMPLDDRLSMARGPFPTERKRMFGALKHCVDKIIADNATLPVKSSKPAKPKAKRR